MAKRGLRSFLRRGVVASEGFITTGASAVSANAASGPSASPYHVRVRSGGTAGNEVLNLPLNGDFVGQRILVTFAVEGNAADVVRVEPAATGATQFAGAHGDAAPTAVTRVELDTPGEFALYEFQGGATPAWNLLYTTGAVV